MLPLGIFLAWVGARYGALVTIGAHVANNTIAIAMARTGHDSEEVAPFGWVVASWLIVLACTIPLARGRAADAPNGRPHGADCVAP